MKFKLIALAAVMVAAGSANAAIDYGASGNGELFFSIWDANGSYTLDLNTTISAFTTDLAAAGSLNLNFATDATFTSFLAGVADTSQLKWNVLAVDIQGAQRLLTTYTALPASTRPNNTIRAADAAVGQFAIAVNGQSHGADSVAVDSANPAYAGNPVTFGSTINTYLNFSNSGTLDNNSYASGLSFMRIDALATGIAKSTYSPYVDNGNDVKIYFDVTQGLSISAVPAVTPVPEPESFAMLLAGLGLIGVVARRRRLAA